jgi:hypothetical protein
MFRPLLNPHARWVPEIGYVLPSSAERKAALDRDHCIWGNCSELIPEVPKAHRRKPMLCFIGFSRGQLSHVARAEVRYKARSGNDKLDMWHVEKLPHPVSIAQLEEALDGKGAGAARRVLDSGGHLPPKALQSVIDALRRVDPEAFERVNSLINRHGASSDSLSEIARENLALQRDAVVTALDIAKIPREQFPPLADPVGGRGGATSIFDGLTEVHGLEDILVMHDLGGAADWSPIRDHRYPAKTFTNGETVLTVVLANKLPLERQLGVDLVYVNETLRCVVFVQYKVMRGKDGEDGYRPDGQLKQEIARMDRVSAMLAGLPTDQAANSYRLGGEAFFLKFCKGILDERDSGMVPGHYLPLGFWKRLETDPRIRGERGGMKVTPKNLPRWFTATEFKEMVAKAWIGTSGIAADAIVPLIREIMESGRTVALAIETRRHVLTTVI